ncbi:MAG: hypothetical protein WC654_06805, partial [Patescibacteria group bacterium]
MSEVRRPEPLPPTWVESLAKSVAESDAFLQRKDNQIILSDQYGFINATQERTGINKRQRETYDRLKQDPRFSSVESSPPGSSAWIRATLAIPVDGITELFIQYSK